MVLPQAKTRARPCERSGEVFAVDRHQAEELFCRKHPRNEYGQVACCSIYDEETFKLIKMYKHGNFGKRCVEVINMEVRR